MRPSTLPALIGVLAFFAAATGVAPAQPATRPATGPAASQPAGATFKLVQETKTEGREPIRATVRFTDGFATLVNEAGETGAFYDVAESAFYSDKKDGMIPRAFADAWIAGWWHGAAPKLKGHPNEAFILTLVKPEMEVREQDGKLLIQTKPIRMEVTPMANVDAAAANAYAEFYALDALRAAFESGNAIPAFTAVQVAAELRKRQVIPAHVMVTTTTPKGTATLTTTVRLETMNAADIAAVQRDVDAMYHPPTEPPAGGATRPTTRPRTGPTTRPVQ